MFTHSAGNSEIDEKRNFSHGPGWNRRLSLSASEVCRLKRGDGSARQHFEPCEGYLRLHERALG